MQTIWVDYSIQKDKKCVWVHIQSSRLGIHHCIYQEADTYQKAMDRAKAMLADILEEKIEAYDELLDELHDFKASVDEL